MNEHRNVEMKKDPELTFLGGVENVAILKMWTKEKYNFVTQFKLTPWRIVSKFAKKYLFLNVKKREKKSNWLHKSQ